MTDTDVTDLVPGGWQNAMYLERRRHRWGLFWKTTIGAVAGFAFTVPQIPLELASYAMKGTTYAYHEGGVSNNPLRMLAFLGGKADRDQYSREQDTNAWRLGESWLRRFELKVIRPLWPTTPTPFQIYDLIDYDPYQVPEFLRRPWSFAPPNFLYGMDFRDPKFKLGIATWDFSVLRREFYRYLVSVPGAAARPLQALNYYIVKVLTNGGGFATFLYWWVPSMYSGTGGWLLWTAERDMILTREKIQRMQGLQRYERLGR
jgi:hypothetical protein